MPEAEPWQIAAFVASVAAILAAGWFIQRPRK
jgi:hypothetical protein